MIYKVFINFIIMWGSIVGYFSDTSEIAAIYGLIT